MEMEIWNIWATNRIPAAIGGLSTIIAVWVAARFSSVASEQSEENQTLVGKILLTLFGGSVILWGVQNNLLAQGNWSAASRAFKNLADSGVEISAGAAQFSETYGVEPSLLNQPVAIVFFVTAFLIIIYSIWFKK